MPTDMILASAIVAYTLMTAPPPPKTKPPPAEGGHLGGGRPSISQKEVPNHTYNLLFPSVGAQHESFPTTSSRVG
jgi:hypothetical protein